MDVFSRTQSSSLEQSTASLYNEGVKFRKVGLHEDAEHKFRAALVRDRRHLPSLLGLGSLLRERGREREGAVILQEASGILAAPVSCLRDSRDEVSWFMLHVLERLQRSPSGFDDSILRLSCR